MKITKEMFASLPVQEAPQGLLHRIMDAINKKYQRRLRLRFGFSVLGLFLSIALFIPVWSNLIQSITDSGFGAYLSLAFSNFSQILSSWQDFALSLLESLPVFSMVSFLAIVLLLLSCISYVARNYRMTFHNF